jgi:uncharacterized protein (UPF0332 family)
MPVVHTDWITFAKGLLGGSEIANRSAASRAYYGAFHLCKPLADKLPDPVDPKGMHDRAIRAMSEYPVSQANRNTAMAIRSLGYKLWQCKSLRTKADYDIHLAFSQTDAEETISLAEKAIASFQTITFP